MSILDEYSSDYPANQNAVDLFKDEWSSRFPDNFKIDTLPGNAGLFEDPRISWANSVLGGFSGCSILELGPLECGHTFMLQNLGARSIIAIEGNKRAYMKCLIAKEICKIDSADILLGDFVTYLEHTSELFDWTIASGVLYHMQDPLKLLKLISDHSSKLLLWTHYYDDAIIKSRVDLKDKFEDPHIVMHQGNQYTLVKQKYLNALDWSGFCGGPAKDSMWLTRESLLQCLADLGYEQIEIAFDESLHPNGPSILIAAQK